MLACLGRDGRAHGTGMYHGAATGRWSGRHFQPQNLPRPIVDDVDPIIDALRTAARISSRESRWLCWPRACEGC